MRVLISELAARTNLPVPTIKFYLREGVLMPGRTVSATSAHYAGQSCTRIVDFFLTP